MSAAMNTASFVTLPYHRHMQGSRVRAVNCRATGGVYTVTLLFPNGKEAVFRAGNSKSMYDIASFAGVHLPASCRQGACTSCVCKLVKGSVQQPKQTCLPPALIKQGYVAICCATPTSDVKLMTHQGAAVRKWKHQQSNGSR